MLAAMRARSSASQSAPFQEASGGAKELRRAPRRQSQSAPFQEASGGKVSGACGEHRRVSERAVSGSVRRGPPDWVSHEPLESQSAPFQEASGGAWTCMRRRSTRVSERAVSGSVRRGNLLITLGTGRLVSERAVSGSVRRLAALAIAQDQLGSQSAPFQEASGGSRSTLCHPARLRLRARRFRKRQAAPTPT